MPSLNITKAREFFESISKEEKVVLFHDSDPDGTISAILFSKFLEKRGVKVKTYAYKYGQEFTALCNPEGFDVIILTDVGLNKETLDEIEKYKHKKFFYNDHHKRDFKIPKEIYDYHTPSGLCSTRNAYEITNLEELDWLSLIGILADAGELYPENNDLIKNLLKKYNSSLEEFKEKYSYKLTNALTYLDDFDEAFNILYKKKSLEDLKDLEKYSKPIEDEIEFFKKDYVKNKEDLTKDIIFYYLNPKYKIKVILIYGISIQNPDKIIIFASPSSNGKHISISARHQNKKMSMPELLKFATKDLLDSNAGGHIAAAGARILKKDLEIFKEKLKKYK